MFNLYPNTLRLYKYHKLYNYLLFCFISSILTFLLLAHNFEDQTKPVNYSFIIIIYLRVKSRLKPKITSLRLYQIFVGLYVVVFIGTKKKISSRFNNNIIHIDPPTSIT